MHILVNSSFTHAPPPPGETKLMVEQQERDANIQAAKAKEIADDAQRDLVCGVVVECLRSFAWGGK